MTDSIIKKIKKNKKNIDDIIKENNDYIVDLGGFIKINFEKRNDNDNAIALVLKKEDVSVSNLLEKRVVEKNENIVPNITDLINNKKSGVSEVNMDLFNAVAELNKTLIVYKKVMSNPLVDGMFFVDELKTEIKGTKLTTEDIVDIGHMALLTNTNEKGQSKLKTRSDIVEYINSKTGKDEMKNNFPEKENLLNELDEKPKARTKLKIK